MTPAELVAQHRHILLDFDGPVCAVFGGEVGDRDTALELHKLVDGPLPADVAASHDAFDVLRYANTIDEATAVTVEARLRELEVECVAAAPETPGAADVIRTLVAAGHVIAIVSNNSTAAVRRYLELHDLTDAITFVSARESWDTSLLKPSTHLLGQAMSALGAAPSTCVMIGDAVTDIEAAHAAGARAIGYADKPGKSVRLRVTADCVTENFHTLVVL